MTDEQSMVEKTSTMPRYKYKVTTRVERSTLDSNSGVYSDEELLAQVAGSHEGDSLMKVFPAIAETASNQWLKVSELVPTLEDDDE